MCSIPLGRFAERRPVCKEMQRGVYVVEVASRCQEGGQAFDLSCQLMYLGNRLV
jgi:hypothetical protein